ncbi:MAG: phenylalanine--tRNA ligase subunit beta [Planctomycetes bacterium]|nr:phenylalanine--tRNA ligase subunit beta [Planctomycetota bacterium]MCW8134109.1 phenylalanine--tRNA ligase subunit beta [Planctomycetota bacterium]
MMKTTHQWLESYVHSGLSPREVADKLTMAGTEVEGFEEVGDDVCFTLEVTSNRTDCLSAIGLARELAATTGRRVQHPKADYAPAEAKAADVSSVVIEPDALKACPYYTAQVIRGVRVGPSPAWLRKRLEGIGLKPINNIVDITNFVLFETGQPLHAFDLNALAGRRIVVRMARAGERFDPLVDRKRDKPEPERPYVKCDTNTLVICDAEKPQAVGGIMGGLTSGVTGKTTDVLLESAYFEPAGIRATSRRLELESDSSYRFERGVDAGGVLAASRRAVALILEVAGGEVLHGVLEAGSIDASSYSVTVTVQDIRRSLGIDVPVQTAAEIFTGLDVPVASRTAESVTVSVPSYRRDLRTPIDLVEEVGRVYGLDRIPAPLRMPVETSKPTRRQRARRHIAESLRGMGFSEALTDTFVKPGESAQFTLFSDGAARLEARNPVNTNLPSLRRNLVGSLLLALATNERQQVKGARLYECANVFHPAPDGKATGERELVGLLGRDYYDLKGAVESLLEVLRVHDALRIEPLEHAAFAPGRAAMLSLGGGLLGVIGEPSAAALREHGAEGPCAVGELDMSRLEQAWHEVPMMRELPRYPVAERDLAFILGAQVQWAQVVAAVRKACDDTLREVELFDEFTGKAIGAGKRSLAFTLRFRRDDRTLTNEEITAQMNAAIDAVRRDLSGELRG